MREKFLFGCKKNLNNQTILAQLIQPQIYHTRSESEYSVATEIIDSTCLPNPVTQGFDKSRVYPCFFGTS